MKKSLLANFVLCVCMLASPAFQSVSMSNSSGVVIAADELPPVQVVDYVDVAQFIGLWYEIAKIPNSFQSFCSGGTTAEYTVLDDGSVGVLNRCRGRFGFPRQARAKAFVDDPETNAKLKVSFVCLLNRCFFFGDYWIIGLGPNYEYAVIGHPTREYGWILSRECSLSDSAMADVQQILKSQYYNFSDFIMTDQSVNGCE